MGFNPRNQIYKLAPLGHNSATRHETDRTGDDRLNQTGMEVAKAGYEVIDRTTRTEPFFPFGAPLNPSKAPAIPANTGADPHWDRTTIKVGEL
jgi:hypothetical protein